MPSNPIIKKALRVTGRTLHLRNVKLEDAEFILSLRVDDQKAKFLTATNPDLSKQRIWLADYEQQLDQAYFIIESITGKQLGTVRLYDAQGASFCWGSWIIKAGAPTHTAIESALIIYAYAQDFLGFSDSHFDVRQGNESVWKFHERFGALKTQITEQDFIYSIDQSSIKLSRKKYFKFLPNHIQVEFK